MTEPKLHIRINSSLKPKNVFGVRHFQFILMFFTIFISFGFRVSLSVSIISMTAKTPLNPEIPSYPEWSNVDIILSSFFWGYVIPQICAGQLSEFFGPKWFLFTSLILGSVANIAIPPLAAIWGSGGVITCRVIQGLTQGILYPSIFNLLSRWCPIFERARISNFVCGGMSLGMAVAVPITGLISGSKYGWPAVFYVYGALGILWAIIFGIYAENSPEDYKKISQEEKIYIQTYSFTTKIKVPTPWRKIVTSLPVWAILIVTIAHCFALFTLMTEMPTYMSHMLKFDINSRTELATLPFLGNFLLGLGVSPLADWLVTRKICTITTVRKSFDALAAFVPAFILIILAFLQDFTEIVVTTLLVIAVSFSSFIYSGHIVNIIDIAPNHSGTITGVINSIGNCFSILGPITVGLFGDNKDDPVLWRNVFLLAAGIYISCEIFYIIFSSAEVQSWNIKDDRTENNKTRSETAT